MSFLDTIDRAKSYLEKNGRVSLRVLKIEFDLDDARLEALVEELVEVQGVALREGEVLAWGSPAEPKPSDVTAASADGPSSPGTPKHLADKILQSKSAIEGERKQVTVLFADVKGSMELSEDLDPEEWTAIMQRFFTTFAEGVERFEGFVDKFTGDGIMALFGAPIAHEDHAQRACYAALHLRDRLRQYADELRIDPGVNFSFRLGLNSGDVIVGTIGKGLESGGDLRMDYTAQGHTVGLAQRMEQLAPADSIALSAHTQKPVEGFFALRSLGPVPVKGAREPVGVFVLEDVGDRRTRLDTSRARGLSRFVGRGDEMSALESAVASALEGGGRVATVVGEAGVGKSRLCSEFLESCRSRGLVVYEAHCPAHGKTIPYLPLLELLRNLFGITDRDGPREARQKIAGELALLDDGFADDRELVLDFLGVGDPNTPSLQLDPAVRQRRLFVFLRRLIQLRTEAEPIVLLIDDLHWIDPGSDLFVAQIVEAVSTTRTLLLVNYRPEYTADWTRKSWVLQLPMAPLGAEALAELVRDWVGSSPSADSLPTLIGERSGGNPFFAEEIVLTLIETGRLNGTRGAYELTETIETVEVPATVQSLLAARTDRLGDREKQLIYSAAVIGKEFSRPILESVAELDVADVEAALSGLLAAEMINERALYPVAEYSFKHPLTHEVALNAQLGPARRRRHATVAAAITAAEADRLDEHAGLLAHHWTEAGEAMRAAEWHVRAARWVCVTDLAASRRHWSEARALLVALPESAERCQALREVYPELLDTFDRLGTESAEFDSAMREALLFAQAAGDRCTEALLESLQAQRRNSLGDMDGMYEHAARAASLADADGERDVRLYTRYVLGRALGWQGRWPEAVAVFDEAVAIGGSDDAARIEVLRLNPFIECRSIRSCGLSVLGRPREALEYHESFPRLKRIAGSEADLSSAACDRIWACWPLGDTSLAARCSGESLQIAERFGSDRYVVYALLGCGMAKCLGGRWAEGSGVLERACERIETTGAGAEWAPMIDAYQALCLSGLNEHERAVALARKGYREASNHLSRFNGVIRARVLRMSAGPSGLDDLEAEIAATHEEMERTKMAGWTPLLLLERAGLCRARGDADGMARDLAEARRLFAEMGVTGWDDYAKSIEG